MTNSKLVIAALAALSLTAGRAYAEGDDADPCGGGEAEGNPCGGGDEGGGDGGAMTTAESGGDATAADGATGLAGYPQAMIDRPRVLPKGLLEAKGMLGLTNISDAIGLGIGAHYGVAPKIDAGLFYAFALKEFEIKGDLTFTAQYSVTESEKMGLAARISTGYSLVGESFDGVGLGLNLIYRVTPKISVGTNGDHISLGGTDFPKPVKINLPVQVGYQVDDKINAFVGTTLATIAVSPSDGTTIIGADVTPLDVGATFSPSNKLDVGAMFSTLNLADTADLYLITVMAAFRM